MQNFTIEINISFQNKNLKIKSNNKKTSFEYPMGLSENYTTARNNFKTLKMDKGIHLHLTIEKALFSDCLCSLTCLPFFYKLKKKKKKGGWTGYKITLLKKKITHPYWL